MIKIVEVGLKPKDWKLTCDPKWGWSLHREGSTIGAVKVDTALFTESEEVSIEKTTATIAGTDVTITEHVIDFGKDRPVRFHSDPRTLNLYIKEDVLNAGKDLIILLVSTSVGIIRYRTEADICNTFHMKKDDAEEKFVGCMILADTTDTTNEKELLRLQARIKDKFVFLQLLGTKVVTSVIKKMEVISSLKSDMKKMKNRFRMFKVTDKGLRTSLLILQKGKIEEEMVDTTLNELVEKFGYPENTDDLRIFWLPEVLESGEMEEAVRCLGNIMTESPKTRALTFYDCQLPKQVLNTLHPLYVFRMSTDGSVECVKSN